jgi:hypothetical protein
MTQQYNAFMPVVANRAYNQKQRMLFGLGISALSGAIALGLAMTLLLMRDRRAADYPGALLLSEHSLYSPFPKPHMRQDTSYRTQDDLPTVYNWYSNGFNLGSERLAQSNCIHLLNSDTSLAFRRQMAVTVCDTPNGRMIFVQRSTSLPFR